MWIYFIIGTVLILVGLAVHVFKWYFLISGYNTMQKEKKANVDTRSLGRLMGIYSYVNGTIFILAGFLYMVGVRNCLSLSYVFFGISTIFLLAKSQKYDGNLYDENGKLRKGAGKQLALPAIIVAMTLVAVAFLFYFSSRPTKITFLEQGLQVQGMYGELYDWEDIEEVRLVEELPNIEMRTNGSALGSNLKGHFRTTEYGAVMLFMNTKNPPFIYLKTKEEIVLLNLGTPDETKKMFGEIIKRKADNE